MIILDILLIVLILILGIGYYMKKYHDKDLDTEKILSDLFEIVDEGIIIFNQAGLIKSVNLGALMLLGYAAEEDLIGKPAELVFSEDIGKTAVDNMKNLELNLITKDDLRVPVILNSLRLKNRKGEMVGTLISFRDLTEIKELFKVKQFAYYDELTKLPNRRLLKERLDRAILDAQKESRPIALLFIDIDFFKLINDSLGHSDGDEFLRQVSFRMSGITRKADTLARVGGDEFILILRNIDITMTNEITNRILNSFNTPFYINDKELNVTASIGISIYPYDGTDGETLIKNADSAMYQAKRNGKNKSEMFNPDLIEHSMA